MTAIRATYLATTGSTHKDISQSIGNRWRKTMQDRLQGTSQKHIFWRNAVLTSRGDGEHIRGLHAGCGNGQDVCNQELERRGCTLSGW